MSARPVWISGLGVISAAGVDAESTLQSFRNQTRNWSRDFPFETNVKQPAFLVDAELPNPAGQHQGNRTFRLAMHAVNQALADANLESIPAGTRVGVCLGTTVGCQLNSLPFYAAYRRGENPPLDRVHDFLNSNLAQATGKAVGSRMEDREARIEDRGLRIEDRESKAAPGESLSSILHPPSSRSAPRDPLSSILNPLSSRPSSAPRLTIVNACSSGTDAIGVAATWLRAGLCDIAIAGGADEMYVVPLSGFWSLGVMSTEPCRPFDRDRAGLNLGEGAGVLILESDEFAQRRNRKHSFQVAGFGSAGDAHHLTAPHPQGRGLEAAIRSAMQQAKVTADQIAFINAHGTATLDNDRTESMVLHKLFGPDLKYLSTKGFTGHTLGAAGGLEAVFSILALRDRWLPASAGFENRGEDVPVSPLTKPTQFTGDYALSTSLAFGGNNAAVLLRRAS
jgi:3-oxoacyl-(acyl-carrier-protein) synthase